MEGGVRGRGQRAPALTPATAHSEGQEEGQGVLLPDRHRRRLEEDIVTFTRLFATMIDAGLPIVQCLDILQGQTDNKHFAAILRDIKGSVVGRAPPSATRCAATRRCSIRSTRTSSRRARWAASSTPS